MPNGVPVWSAGGGVLNLNSDGLKALNPKAEVLLGARGVAGEKDEIEK
jgi:hypothetical protein